MIHSFSIILQQQRVHFACLLIDIDSIELWMIRQTVFELQFSLHDLTDLVIKSGVLRQSIYHIHLYERIIKSIFILGELTALYGSEVLPQCVQYFLLYSLSPMIV